MDAKNKLTWEDVKGYLPENVCLFYADYQDSLDGREKEIQTCIHNQDYEAIDSVIDEWVSESQDDSIDYIIKELKDDLNRDYDFDDPDELDNILDEYHDDIREYCWDNDTSTPLKDLLRNTSDPVCFYDTGYYVPDGMWAANRSEYRAEREQVKRALQIPSKNHQYDADIELMLGQAGYGGRLVVYFRFDLSGFDELVNAKFNTIRFENPMIAIIDTYSGSGDSADLPGHICEYPYAPDSLWIDKTIKYNYTYAVCGMSSDWCDCTKYTLYTKEKTRKVKPSSMKMEQSVEDRYNEIYKQGGCTFGDMDMRRHRKTYYDNNFPCGTHCPSCKTFWID